MVHTQKRISVTLFPIDILFPAREHWIRQELGIYVPAGSRQPVWPDWAIYWALGKFLKLLRIIIFPKYHTFLGNFCKGVKIYHFGIEIIFGQLLYAFGDFFWSHCRQPIVGWPPTMHIHRYQMMSQPWFLSTVIYRISFKFLFPWFKFHFLGLG